MTGQKRIYSLLAVLIIIVIAAIGTSFSILYNSAFEQQKLRLIDTVKSQARLIGAVARYDQGVADQLKDKNPDYNSFEATLSQLREGHANYGGLGETGEFLLAKHEADQIIFLLNHRHHDFNELHPISFSASEAEPMRRALSGKSGTIVGLDYHGEMVLAAYEPVSELSLGIVAKIDLAEIRGPFINAGLIVFTIAVCLIIIGITLMLRIGNPMVVQLTENEATLKANNVRLEVLWNLSLANDTDVRTFSKHILQTIGKITDSKFGFYGFVNDDESEMTIHSWCGNAMENCKMADKPAVFPVSEAGVWGEAIRRREPLILNDYNSAHPAKKGLPAGHVPLTSLLVVPNFTNGKITSVAAVANRQLNYGQHDIDQLTTFMTNIQTIVDSKKAERALQESEQRLKDLMKSVPVGISVSTLDGRILESNRLAYEMFGYDSLESLSSVPISDYYCNPKDRERFIGMLKKGSVRDFEVELKHKDGHKIWCMVNSVRQESQDGTIQFVNALQDITERKRAEQEIETIFNMTGYMVCTGDLEGHFTRVNDSFVDILGYTKEELVGKPYLDFIHPEDINKTADIIEIEKTDGSIVTAFENRYRCKDGTYKWLSWTSQPDPKMGVSYAIAYDITDRKHAEEALKETEERFRTAITEAPVPIMIHAEDGEVLHISKVWTDITGYSHSEIPTIEEWASLAYGQKMENGKAIIEAVVERDAIAHDGEFTIKIKSGATRIWDFSSGPIGKLPDGRRLVISMATDITERKQAEIRLRKSEEKHRNLFELSNDPIFVHSLKGKILDVNSRACEMLGYSRDQLLSMTLPNLHPEGELAKCAEAVRTTEQEGSTVFESLFITADGSVLNVSISSKIVDHKSGTVQGIVRDITETKRLQELESRAKRLEMAGTIAGQVAHDFNNLLGPIIAYPEFIHEELPHDNIAHAYVDAIEDAAQKIANINQDLLTMGRRGHYNHDVIDLNRIVLQVVEEIKSGTKSVSVEKHLCQDLMKIKGGSAQIHRMLTNLLLNALDAIQDIGEIAIRTENYYADGTSIAFGRVPKGEYVKLTVSDNGCGISDDIMQKILDPFFSTKIADKKRGSGLGLSVVDAVIKDHNGYLDLSSKVGHGTSFFLYFPSTREDIGDDALGHLTGGTESILVVDDDDVQRDVSSRLLMKLGYKVSTVESGEKAVAFIQKNPQDIVILDMVMPGGIDGAETYRRILENNPYQKAIILSGFSESDRVLEAQKLGAGTFVKKPITKQALASAVRTELDRREKVLT